MNHVVLTKTYSAPPVCKKEVLRYAGCGEPDSELLALLDSCIEEMSSKLTYKVCFCRLPVSVSQDICDMDLLRLKSRGLAKNLQNCKNVILFAATVGVEPDRLVLKYGRVSPAKALLMQALGAERIEALCDAFCEDMARELNTRLGRVSAPVTAIFP